MVTRRGAVVTLVLCTGAAIGVNSSTSAHCVDSDTGRNNCTTVVRYEDGSASDGSCTRGAACDDSTILVHVAGPKDSGGAYRAEEDTAWCVAPSVEVSYTSNPDGSGTVECAK